MVWHSNHVVYKLSFNVRSALYFVSFSRSTGLKFTFNIQMSTTHSEDTQNGMHSFPSHLHVDFRRQFPSFLYEHHLSKFRELVYCYIISNNVEDYIQLPKFQEEYNVSQTNMNRVVKTVVDELSELGWQCALAYGNTGFFVYSDTDEPPSAVSYTSLE